MDSKKLVVERGQVKAALTRFKTHIDNAQTVQELRAMLEKHDPLFDKFNALHDQIEETLHGREHEDNHKAERETFEKTYFQLIGTVRERIESVQTQNTRQFVPTTASGNQTPALTMPQLGIKLPTIILPEFSGNYSEWIKFRDSFESMIHSNESLSNIQRFHYLNSALKGEAFRVIKSLGVSDANCALAWKSIKERYEDPRLLIYHHVDAIVEAPKLTRESYTALRQLIDDAGNHIAALQSLANSMETMSDTLIRHILSKKLDPATKREWDKHQASDSKVGSVRSMTEFLEQHCKYLETSSIDRQAVPSAPPIPARYRPNRGQVERTTAHLASTHTRCGVCNGNHPIFRCDEFKGLIPAERRKKVQQLKVCFNCLGTGHQGKDCMRGACRKCNQKHNTLLHIDQVSPQAQDASPLVATARAVQELTQPSLSISNQPPQKLLSTAMVYLLDKTGSKHECRALLDPGSQMNFLTTSFCRKLKIPQQSITTEISGVGRSTRSITRNTHVTLLSRCTGYKTSLSCLVLPEITDDLPSGPIDVNALSIPPHITLADPHFHNPGKIDLLLGVDVCWDLLCVGQHVLGPGLPKLQKTLLGWIAGGRAPISSRKPAMTPVCHSVTNQQLHNQLAKFWESGETLIDNDKWELDLSDECERHFRNTVTRDLNGRYIVAIPFKQGIERLGDSRQMAERRLLSMERRLAKQPNLKEQYIKFMEEYEALGHMSPIADSSLDRSAYYLPHHAVFKENSTTTKLRVVFDGSAKTSSGISLNDMQLVRPTVQDDLLSIVLRFRGRLYVLSGDISKMYRQIWVRKIDRGFQQLLWRSDPSEPIRVYQLNTITYGTASASFLATRVLRHIGELHKQEFPAASRAIIRDFYVDDLLTGANSIEDIRELKRDITQILAQSGLELRKWAANDPLILNDNAPLEAVSIQADKDPKTLGLLWNPDRDSLHYSVKSPPDRCITKRTILSDISQIFDPLGLIGPAIIQAKLILRSLWELQLSWDEAVPQSIYTLWERFRSELDSLNQITIPRQAICANPKSTQLHGFCDASEKAFGACIYLRSVDEAGQCLTRLLCAKSRVAPIKTISIPRLELCGATLLARLANKARSALEIDLHEEYFWSDSEVALAWIKSSPSRWQTYVANRTSEIQKLTGVNWHHVPSEENPADIISRGISSSALSDISLWWQGPGWLSKPSSEWPSKHVNLDEAPEKRKAKVLTTTRKDTLKIFERYSSLTRLIRVMAFCLRFLHNTRHSLCKTKGIKDLETIPSKPKTQLSIGSLAAHEHTDARNVLIKLAQQSCFAEELRNLHHKEPLPSASKLISLNAFVDEQGLIRVGGRLANAPIPFDERHPIILPSHHTLTKLIIKHEHLRLLHGGCQAVLTSLRKQYWPIAGKNTVKGVIRGCVRCCKAKPSIPQYVMGNLPASRVTPARPFFVCGVDYAGPFLIKEKTRNRTLIKAYICIFVYFTTKAVHIELAIDMSTHAFLNCLRRFISRRGLCQNIYSDNGSNFIGARNELKELGALLSDPGHNTRVSQFLVANQTQWHLIPPRAPHFGGLWESAVKSAKYHLKRGIGETTLTYEELYTVLTQVEACLNSRPLCPLSEDPEDLSPLTPAHFLIGDSLTALPHPDLREIKQNRLNRYQHLQQISQHFWHRWRNEYLQQLQQRNKWQMGVPSKFGPGTLVTIKEDNLPPMKWRMGRIIDTHPGKDAITRVVTIRVSDGVIKRPVSKICILPTADEDSKSPKDEVKQTPKESKLS